MTLQFGEMGAYRSVPTAETSMRSLAGGRQSILIAVQFDEAFETVAHGFFVEGQPMTVEVSKFNKLLVQRGYHPSEFLEPRGPHAHGAKTTDFAGSILVTMRSD